MRTQLLDAAAPAAVRKAADLLKRGQTVAFPTETVYGLGADAYESTAVARIFEAKKRPFFDPLIVHAATVEQALESWREIPPLARLLIKRFWPGPLTLVLKKSRYIPDLVTSGLDTVAVRIPRHPVALALIRELGRPVAAPSANVFGYTSPTTARDVMDDLKGRIPAILDGGTCEAGVESTILKIEHGTCQLLRPGAVPLEALHRICGKIVVAPRAAGSRPDAPGRLESHYAPHTPLFLAAREVSDPAAVVRRAETFLGQPSASGVKLGLLQFKRRKAGGRFAAVEYLSAEGDLVEAASNLFQAIRKLDKMKLHGIIAEPVPCRALGRAIMDRLLKASSGRIL